MIISNSLGKLSQDNFTASSVLLRSDGFKKITKGGFASTQALQKPKISTSNGLRRYTKEYKIRDHNNIDSHLDYFDSSTPMSRIFTPGKEGARRMKISANQKLASFLQHEQQEEQSFRNVCKMMNIE